MTKIDRIDAIIIDVPTVRGHVLSMTTMMTQSVVLVRVRFSDGSEGLGEGASIGGLSYGPESVESVKLAIDTYIAPALVGMNGNAIAAACAHMEKAVKGNPIARAAVECALWDGLSVTPDMGLQILIPTLIVIVIGGLGSLKGAVAGSLIFGFVQTFGAVLLPTLSSVLIYALLAAVLVIRPQGLLPAKG